MNKPIPVKPQLSLEEAETCYRKAKEAVERSHWQIIWLLAKGKTTKEIQEFTGYCLAWIRTIAHRYNEGRSQADGATAAIVILAGKRFYGLNCSSNCGRRCIPLSLIRAYW